VQSKLCLYIYERYAIVELQQFLWVLPKSKQVPACTILQVIGSSGIFQTPVVLFYFCHLSEVRG